MAFSWSTFALQAVNFLILLWLLKRFLFKPVRAIVARRKEEIARAQAEAEAARQSAEQARKEVAARQSEIEAQGQGIIAQARADLAAERSKMIEAARADIEKLKAAALKQIEEERDNAVRDVLDQSAQIGLQVAERLLREFAGPRLDELFLDSVLDHLDRLAAAERTALLSDLGHDGGQLIVTTASSLNDATASKWRVTLSGRLGGSPQIIFAVNKELIAGTELQFPRAFLCFSWRQALTDARREFTQHVHVH